MFQKGLEWTVDADFADNWKDDNHDKPEPVLSRTGFVIMFASCPITWQRKLQTEIDLSTTNIEYVALSSAMREVIPFLKLLQEISNVFGLPTTAMIFRCKFWEDNKICIKVALAAYVFKRSFFQRPQNERHYMSCRHVTTCLQDMSQKDVSFVTSGEIHFFVLTQHFFGMKECLCTSGLSQWIALRFGLL